MLKSAPYNINMSDKLKPRRAGVTRKMAGLPTIKVQLNALLDDGCDPVYTWEQYTTPQAQASFLDNDVLVAVHAKVFGKGATRWKTATLGDGMRIKATTGPKPKLAKATADQWKAIRWVYRNTKPKEGNAVALSAHFGLDVTRDDIRYRDNAEKAIETLAAIGNEGKE